MPWYRITFPRAEASVKIADLAQDFFDTVQSAETRDGIALYRKKPVPGNDSITYFVSLNTSRPSRRLFEVYRAAPCPAPEPHEVDHFGGDSTVLSDEQT